MLKGAFGVALSLSQRNWQIWKAKDDAPDLICSDFPLSPTWAIPFHDHRVLPVMLDSPFTLVSMPLNRRFALIGVLDEELPEIAMRENDIAAVNSMTIMHANQLYSSESDFVWSTVEGSIGKREDLKRTLEDTGK